MAGKIRKIIDTIIEKRAKGNPVLVKTTRVKFFVKGIHPDKYTRYSEDDPVVITKLEILARDLGIDL